MKNQHELKSLQVRKTKLEVEIKTLEKDKNIIISEINNKKNNLNSIRQKIKNLAIKEPIVSEHAMLRYIERVMNINLQEIENRILTEDNRKMIKFTGSCTIKSDGIELIVKDSCVISVVASNGRDEMQRSCLLHCDGSTARSGGNQANISSRPFSGRASRAENNKHELPATYNKRQTWNSSKG